jgi:sugar lactone lactonase YvrE
MQRPFSWVVVLALLAAGLDVSGCGDGEASVKLGPSVGGEGGGSPCDGPALRRSYETVVGLGATRGFAFDREGRLVTVDRDGNLVRQTRGGEPEVWVAGVTTPGASAAMAFLPNGDLAISDGQGSLFRVTQARATSTLASGLAGPAGLVASARGLLYVAEQAGGRIREVDPSRGSSRVIASGLRDPTGVGLSPDGRRLYVSSHGTGIVYVIERGSAAGWQPAVELARTPNAPGDPELDGCVGKSPGAACEELGVGYRCRTRDRGLLCEPPDPCDGLDEGQACTTGIGLVGACNAERRCTAINPCAGSLAGEACVDGVGAPGLCTEDPWAGGLYCGIAAPCEGLGAGDPCTAASGMASCVDDGYGALVCRAAAPCDGLAVGDSCVNEYGASGTCTDDGWGTYCRPPAPCDGLAVGDSCVSEYGVSGTCMDDGLGQYCQPLDPCAGRVDGEACLTWDAMAGRCVDSGFSIDCVALLPCETKAAGDPCVEFGADGVCTEAPTGELYCRPPGPCDGLAVGDTCVGGVCADDGTGRLFCRPPEPCDGLAEGDACTIPGLTRIVIGGTPGTCQVWSGSGGTGPGGCSNTCPTANDTECDDGGPGSLYSICLLGTDCADCGTRPIPGAGGAGGSGGEVLLECVALGACAGLEPGDACSDPYFGAGVCEDPTGSGIDLVCTQVAVCDAGEIGAPCTDPYLGPGTCQDASGTGWLVCVTDASSAGALGGLAVDDCGYLYVVEDEVARVWRITPDGAEVAPVIDLPSGSFLAAGFGSPVGGWPDTTLYFMESESSTLYGVPVRGEAP